MNQWKKDIVRWRIGPVQYLSIPFTWMLPEAQKLINGYNHLTIVGGPAVDLMPDYLTGAGTQVKPDIPALHFHNPLATFTTRGCPNRCPFCAVPRIEGEFRELDHWEVKPVICDNNFLASSRRHFDAVIDSLKSLPHVDFNQGLEARRFTAYHAGRMAELKSAKVRFALDHVSDEDVVVKAIATAREAGLRDFGVYVLIGFKETPDDARYRLELLRGLGIRPTPMRYQPLDAMAKNAYVAPAWSEAELRKMMKYYSRLRWLEHIPYEEFRPDPPMFEVWGQGGVAD